MARTRSVPSRLGVVQSWDRRHVRRSLGRAGLLALLVVGCRSGSATHLIPDGYVGPVVVVYGVPGGETPRMEGRNVTYQIKATGVLRVAVSAPPAGTVISFHYVKPDGSRQRLAHGGEKESLQVFNYVDGVTAKGVTQGETRRWSAYVVGVPGARDDWGSVLDVAIAAARSDTAGP